MQWLCINELIESHWFPLNFKYNHKISYQGELPAGIEGADRRFVT